jgi:hypothetical protein
VDELVTVRFPFTSPYSGLPADPFLPPPPLRPAKPPSSKTNVPQQSSPPPLSSSSTSTSKAKSFSARETAVPFFRRRKRRDRSWVGALVTYGRRGSYRGELRRCWTGRRRLSKLKLRMESTFCGIGCAPRPSSFLPRVPSISSLHYPLLPCSPSNAN